MPAKRPTRAPDRLDYWLGQRLARRRRELCLTLDELEQRIGAPPGTVARYEKGLTSVGVADLLAIAHTLGVSVAWFFASPPPGGTVEPGTAAAPKRIAEAERFIAAYWRINDPKIRRDILGLIKAAGE